MSKIIPYRELQALSGYDAKHDTPADVVAWAEREGIKLFTGKYNRPSTTVDALNNALGVGGDVPSFQEEKDVVVIE